MDTMEKIADGYCLEPKKERVFVVLSGVIVLLLTLLFILQKVIGFDGIIESIYFGRSFGFLNNLIKYQQTKPVEYYISLVDILFYRGIFMSFVFLGFLNLVVRSVLFKKPPRPIWVFLFGTVVVMGTHVLNPNNRIYSSHGFLHAGIVYEILNGHIPPNNPLLAELPLYWPWGHHFLAAVFVKTLNISPSWAFCFINILALAGVVFITYKISSMLIKCRRANILSVLIAIFAVSFVHGGAIPIFSRVTNISGMPIGMCLYLWFIYMVLLVFSPGPKWKIFLIPLFLSVVSVGFFYFQFFLGLLGSFGFFLIFRVVRFLKNRNNEDAQKIIFAALTVLMGVISIMPYVLPLLVNAKGKLDILVPGFIWENLKNLTNIFFPMLVITCLNLKSIKEKLNQQVLRNFLFLTLGVMLTYIVLRIPLKNEYKIMSQFMVLFGILGGIALSFFGRLRAKVFVILLVLFLGYNFFMNSNSKLNKKFKEPPQFESGSRIVAIGEEAEIYEWLLENTTSEVVVIDSEIKVPYLAQRSLYAAKDTFINGKMKFQHGYNLPILVLYTAASGYDEQMIDYRYSIIDKIYGKETPITDQELDDFFLTHPDVLIIFRNQEPKKLLSMDKISLAFESSNGNFKIYRPR
jgi:hypothetical protein